MESINKYQNGKIYKIISKEMPGLVYYGSTIQTLKQRMSVHAAPSNKACSKLLFGNGIPEIILIKDYPCNSRKELEIEEGKYHRGNECINKNVAGRTDKEYREDNKENNKEKCKNYREKNKEIISEQSKIYYIDNKEKIQKKKKEKYDCECGSKYSYSDKARHFKTKKHQSFISSKIV